MRCYFHLVGASQVFGDEQGSEVDDPEMARRVALLTLAEMLLEGEIEAFQLRGWCLVVADASGTALFTISLDRLLV